MKRRIEEDCSTVKALLSLAGAYLFFGVLERGVNREGGLLRRRLNKAFTVFRMEAQIVSYFVMALLGEFPCVSHVSQ